MASFLDPTWFLMDPLLTSTMVPCAPKVWSAPLDRPWIGQPCHLLPAFPSFTHHCHWAPLAGRSDTFCRKRHQRRRTKFCPLWTFLSATPACGGPICCMLLLEVSWALLLWHATQTWQSHNGITSASMEGAMDPNGTKTQTHTSGCGRERGQLCFRR